MRGTNHDTAMNLAKIALTLVAAEVAPGSGLHGRRAECAMLDRLVADVRAGQRRVLVLRGGPGTGKTALLDYLAGQAAGCRLVRVAGIEPEIEFALDERVRDQLIAEAQGNPQALLELPRALTPAELAGGFALPSAVPVPSQVEEDYRRQLALLPAATQLLLLIAAAEPAGDPVLAWRAAGYLGVPSEAAEPAAAAGLVEFSGQIRFCHPHARAAIYQAATPRQRQSVHGALAQTADSDVGS